MLAARPRFAHADKLTGNKVKFINILHGKHEAVRARADQLAFV
jgi:hypothetical protein